MKVIQSGYTRQLLIIGKANSYLRKELRAAMVIIYITITILACLFNRNVWETYSGRLATRNWDVVTAREEEIFSNCKRKSINKT